MGRQTKTNIGNRISILYGTLVNAMDGKQSRVIRRIRGVAVETTRIKGFEELWSWRKAKKKKKQFLCVDWLVLCNKLPQNLVA